MIYWGEGGILSLDIDVTAGLRLGMTFHIPVVLRVFGQFTVGVSETVVVTETGCRIPARSIVRSCASLAETQCIPIFGRKENHERYHGVSRATARFVQHHRHAIQG
jgi:hypothetical protein